MKYIVSGQNFRWVSFLKFLFQVFAVVLVLAVAAAYGQIITTGTTSLTNGVVAPVVATPWAGGLIASPWAGGAVVGTVW